ncbi:MAG: hypothetical protein COT17_08495 [Elusimicrobia bacterium CG08_land_8_20_14_0_20_51_18]|nr:MAG: hypothetical protein COT17_08495 [Elusimicrobia bacterium CG08_land_8_20_14_0_20_51_18]
MKNRILLFSLAQLAFLPVFCDCAPAPPGLKGADVPSARSQDRERKPSSFSNVLTLVRENKLALEKAIESRKYGAVSSADVVGIYNNLELAETFLSEIKERVSDGKISSQLREASEQVKKSKLSAARLNDIIKSKSGRNLYAALAALEADLGEVVLYLNGLRLKTGSSR